MPGKFNAQDYIDVQDRINRFWSEHPDGAIDTDVTYSPDFEHVVITAKVYKHRDDTRPSASGIAGEMKSGIGANQTSWHENGETSAIGRALANMGYATSLKDRPSKQEMHKVVRQAGEIDDRAVSQRPAARQDSPQKPTNAPGRNKASDRQLEMIRERWGALRLDPMQMNGQCRKWYGQQLELLTRDNAEDMIRRLDRKITAASPQGVTPQPAQPSAALLAEAAAEPAGMDDEDYQQVVASINAGVASDSMSAAEAAERWTR